MSTSRNLLILIAVLAPAIGAIFFFQGQTEADRLIAECSRAQSRDICYTEKVPELYPSKKITEIFDIVQEIRTKDPGYQFCHLLAHKLGEKASAGDPTRWIELIPQNP